jgi:hypothetical protein
MAAKPLPVVGDGAQALRSSDPVSGPATDPLAALGLGAGSLAAVMPGPLASLGRPPFFAHHPTCGRYDHHLLRPFGVPLCLGCASGSLGGAAALGAILLVSLPGGLPATWAGAAALYGLALAGYLPSLAQPFVQRRWFKIPARAALGAGIVAAAAAVLALPWTTVGIAVKAALCITTYGLYQFSARLRLRKIDNPCAGCPFGAYPLCAHNLPALRILRDRGSGDAFLDILVAQLEPLARTPIRPGAVPELAAGDSPIQFSHVGADGRVIS